MKAQTFLAAIGATFLVVALMFVLPALCFLGGAFSGWIVFDVCFDDTFNSFFRDYLHLGLAPWQVGGLLGFVGSFFKSSLTTKES